MSLFSVAAHTHSLCQISCAPKLPLLVLYEILDSIFYTRINEQILARGNGEEQTVIPPSFGFRVVKQLFGVKFKHDGCVTVSQPVKGAGRGSPERSAHHPLSSDDYALYPRGEADRLLLDAARAEATETMSDLPFNVPPPVSLPICTSEDGHGSRDS